MGFCRAVTHISQYLKPKHPFSVRKYCRCSLMGPCIQANRYWGHETITLILRFLTSRELQIRSLQFWLLPPSERCWPPLYLCEWLLWSWGSWALRRCLEYMAMLHLRLIFPDGLSLVLESPLRTAKWSNSTLLRFWGRHGTWWCWDDREWVVSEFIVQGVLPFFFLSRVWGW